MENFIGEQIHIYQTTFMVKMKEEFDYQIALRHHTITVQQYVGRGPWATAASALQLLHFAHYALRPTLLFLALLECLLQPGCARCVSVFVFSLPCPWAMPPTPTHISSPTPPPPSTHPPTHTFSLSFWPRLQLALTLKAERRF